MAIRGVAEKRRKAGRRVEPRKAKPIDAAVATHQRASLRVTKKSVVLDPCGCLRHSDSCSCCYSYSTYSEFAKLASSSRVSRNTVHSSIGFAPSVAIEFDRRFTPIEPRALNNWPPFIVYGVWVLSSVEFRHSA